MPTGPSNSKTWLRVMGRSINFTELQNGLTVGRLVCHRYLNNNTKNQNTQSEAAIHQLQPMKLDHHHFDLPELKFDKEIPAVKEGVICIRWSIRANWSLKFRDWTQCHRKINQFHWMQKWPNSWTTGLQQVPQQQHQKPKYPEWSNNTTIAT